MNLLNIFKKLERITPQHKTVYPPYRNRVVSKYVTDDNTKRITIPKEPYNNSGRITGVRYTIYPDNRPTINEWTIEVKFSIDYEKIRYEEFKQQLMEKDEIYNIVKQNQLKNGIQPFKIPTSTKIINFLSKHL